LKAPASEATRPTSDFVRGAIFDLLENLAEDWDQVLDLYAGSGALGIEALSRGAGRADFVDQDPRACRAIRENLTAAHLMDVAQVHQTTASRALSYVTGPYGLVFVDPPYHDTEAYKTLGALTQRHLLSRAGVLIVEHATRIPLHDPGEPLRRVQERRYGDTTVALFMVEEGATVDHRGLPGDV
jgi:16S rRNA (guanine966-N2)-methyltransferase